MTTVPPTVPSGEGKKVKPGYKTVSEHIAQASTELRDRYEALQFWIKALGDDVQENVLQYYVAFKRLKNFCCVEVHPKSGTILPYVKVAPQAAPLEEGFTAMCGKSVISVREI